MRELTKVFNGQPLNQDDTQSLRKWFQLENQAKQIRLVQEKDEKQNQKLLTELSQTKEKLNRKSQHKLITYQDDTQSLRKWLQEEFSDYKISERELWKFLASHRDKFMRVIPATKSANVLVNYDYGENVGDSIAFNDAIIPYIQEFLGENNISKGLVQPKLF